MSGSNETRQSSGPGVSGSPMSLVKKSVQWAAVSTMSGATSVPEQKPNHSPPSRSCKPPTLA